MLVSSVRWLPKLPELSSEGPAERVRTPLEAMRQARAGRDAA